MSRDRRARRSPRDPATGAGSVLGSSPGCSFRARRASTTRTRAPRRCSARLARPRRPTRSSSTLDDVVTGFGGRHRDLLGTFERHAAAVADRLEPGCELSDARRLLLGATFTSEYAIEGAALCNPSIVAHPDQSGVPAGSLRFVMSVRAIGEGHRSSIGFRTGTIDATGRRDRRSPRRGSRPPGRHEPSRWTPPPSGASSTGSTATGRTPTTSSTRSAPQFSPAELDARLLELQANLTTRRHAERTIDAHPRHRRADLRRRVPRRHAVAGACPVAVHERRVPRDGGRPLRAVHPRRRRASLLRDLHRLRRRRDQPAAAGDHRLLHLHVVAARR